MANPEIEVSANHQLSELVERAASSSEIITLASHGQSKAVLVSLEAFEYLVGRRAYRQQLLPVREFSPAVPLSFSGSWLRLMGKNHQSGSRS